ncbi:MAG TPA: Dabb family protein [Microlunatus sp.]
MTSAIQHTVAFRLQHPAGSDAERDFLATGLTLADIPGVQDFQQLRQVSPKSDFTFSFTMRFDDAAAYQAYNDHPTHVAFVRDRWQSEVVDFSELDFVALD